MREIRVAALALSILSTMSGIALAGGSWLEAYENSYQAGETVVMRGDVSPGQLGWIEDGPFYAYLRVDPIPDGDCFNCRRESDIYLGELDLQELSSGWVHVSIAFTLPEGLRHGEYWVVYCNDPCTEGLGDLIGGLVRVITPTRPLGPTSGFLFPV